MNIGNIEDGFYVDKIKNLMNLATMTEEQCKNCWAINLCRICPNEIDDGDQLSYEKKLEACKRSKLEAEHQLREYIAVREIIKEEKLNA